MRGGYIQLLLEFKNKEQLDEAIEYIKKNVSQLYLRYEEKQNGQKYIIFDPNADISKQIVYHNKEIDFEFKDYRKRYQIIDLNRPFELHIFNGNKLIIISQHNISDGKFMVDLIKNIENKTKKELRIPDNEFIIFQDEYAEYKKNLQQGLYKPKYENKYEVNENQESQQIYEFDLIIDISKEPQLQYRISQKLIIVQSLYKLYALKQKGKLDNIDQLLSEGIAISNQYITDGRKYTKKEYNFGSCPLCFFENYILKGNKTVKYYIQYFIDSMNNMVKQKEQFIFLNMMYQIIINQEMKSNNKIINGIHFSNIGSINTNYYKNIQLGIEYNSDQLDTIETVILTYNNQMRMTYRTPKEYKNYKMDKIITILLKNIQDDKTIEELWDLIKNE